MSALIIKIVLEAIFASIASVGFAMVFNVPKHTLIYCAFGLNGYNAFQLITLQSVLYATVSGIPSPGAVGVTEGGFLSLFNGVFPNEIISSAMLLNRGVSFYLYVLLSGIFVSVISIKTKKETKKDV